jgi:Sec-independent protein translocase protein TatA
VFGFSGGEILLIALIALILFGNDKLPDNLKKMIKGLNQAKKVAKDVQISWQDVKNDVQRSINFEEEKEEVRALVKSATIDFDEVQVNNHIYPIPDNFAVPQQDIDELNDNYLLQNAVNSEIDQSFQELREEQEDMNYKREYLSSNEFMMSSDFVGPRI